MFLIVSDHRLELVFWNVEGLLDVKLVDLQEFMLALQLDVMCL